VNPTVLPPCQAGCPVRTDAGRYARLVAEGRYEEAYEVITRTNPFPSVCAYICQRPCEKNCRRAALDAALGLRALKRFVVEKIGENRPRANPLPATGARVAIVGAGPAGLTAARDLRMAGHRVAVFERLDRAGGMLNVIPRYRLPQRALDSDLEAILSLGIETHFGCEMGRDATVAELLERGYDAVVVGPVAGQQGRTRQAGGRDRRRERCGGRGAKRPPTGGRKGGDGLPGEPRGDARRTP